jgi:DNA-binding transcriptional MerR regulator
MTSEDELWLENARRQYTPNDKDQLQKICKQISNTNLSVEDLTELLEKLQELIQN